MLAIQADKGLKPRILSHYVNNGDIDAINDPSSLFRYYGYDAKKARAFLIPCGRCTECRLKRSRDMANRIYLETKSYPDNWAVTLTYDDEHLPLGKEVVTDDGEICSHPTLCPEDLTAFNKAVRQYFKRKFSHDGIKFYAAAEYGEKHYRPHFHLIYFNLPLPATDVSVCKNESSQTGEELFESKILSSLWKKGRVRLNSVSWQYAAYCARYIMKKQLGETSSVYDKLGIVPEFTRCSTKEGIGKKWYEENKENMLFFDSFLVRQGDRVVSAALPPYFLKLAEKDGYNIEALKEKRRELAAANLLNTMSNISQDYGDYLRDLEVEKKSQAKSLPRTDF